MRGLILGSLAALLLLGVGCVESIPVEPVATTNTASVGGARPADWPADLPELQEARDYTDQKQTPKRWLSYAIPQSQPIDAQMAALEAMLREKGWVVDDTWTNIADPQKRIVSNVFMKGGQNVELTVEKPTLDATDIYRVTFSLFPKP